MQAYTEAEQVQRHRVGYQRHIGGIGTCHLTRLQQLVAQMRTNAKLAVDGVTCTNLDTEIQAALGDLD